MTFKLFDHVRIIKNDVTGIVLDVFKDSAGKVWYAVESDQEGHRDDAVIKDGWPTYYCKDGEIEGI